MNTPRAGGAGGVFSGRLRCCRVRLTELTKSQAEYLGIDVAGPYKPEHYRY